jgi:hypothetical protein
MCGVDLGGSGEDPVAGYWEHGNEPPIKGEEFLDQLSDRQLLKGDSTLLCYLIVLRTLK